jgi:hypothetical protein
VTDRGTEWDGQFASLLSDCFIDHRRTSANRPQSNGLAELQKQLAGKKEELERWDTLVAWVALAYRATPHNSSKVAPYTVLYATKPTIPPNIMESMREMVEMDGSEEAAGKQC